MLSDLEQVIPLMPALGKPNHQCGDYLGKVKVWPVTSEFSDKVRFVEPTRPAPRDH